MSEANQFFRYGKYLVVVLLVLTVGGAAWFIGTGGKLSQAGAPAGSGATGTTAGGTPTGCPDNKLTTLTVKAEFQNYSAKNAIQGRNTTVQVFRADTATSLLSTTSSATGEIQPATVACGVPLNVFVGDGGASTAYTVLTAATSAQMSTSQYPVYDRVLIPSALSSTKLNNGSGLYTDATNVVVNNVGSSNNEALVRLTSGTFAYGDGAFEICAQYPQANISDVDVQPITSGFVATPIAADPAVSVVSGNRMSCYEMSGVQMINNQNAEFRIVPQFNGVVTAANVTLSFNDRSTFIKNGKFLPGNDGTPGRYVDDRNNDLGQAVTTITNAITYNS